MAVRTRHTHTHTHTKTYIFQQVYQSNLALIAMLHRSFGMKYA